MGKRIHDTTSDLFLNTIKMAREAGALDAIQAIEAAEAARVYAAANRRELYCMTRAKKLRVRKKYYNRVKRRIAKR